MTALPIMANERYLPFSAIVEGRTEYNRNFLVDLAAMFEKEHPDFVFASLWGNQHFILSTAKSPKSFDFILPDEPTRDRVADAQLIPFEMMKSLMAIHFQGVDFLLRTLKSLTSAPIILAPAPPPVEDFSAIPDGNYNPQLNARVEQFGIAAPTLRYKFWKLCDELHRGQAAAHGATLLPLPAETITADGFRRPEYYSRDWIHANIAYGELVLKQLDRVVGGVRDSEAA